jgi:uncharacterized protein
MFLNPTMRSMAVLAIATAAAFGQVGEPKTGPTTAPTKETVAPAQPEAISPKAQEVRVRKRTAGEPVKVLFCTASFGFKHDVLPLAREIMAKHGEKLEWLEVTTIESADSIAGTNLLPTLATIDVLMLYTTGKLPFEAAELAAWVEAGGTLVGVHSATDTLSDDPDYVPLIGAVFDGHPWTEEVTLVASDAPFRQPELGFRADYLTNPSRYEFRINDEIYQFKQLSKDRTVLIRLAPGQPKMEEGRDYPLAWTSVRGKGMVFYTALGHRPEVWNNEQFQAHVLNGIWWASEHSGDRTCEKCDVVMKRLQIAYGLFEKEPDPEKFVMGFRCPKCSATVVLGEN